MRKSCFWSAVLSVAVFLLLPPQKSHADEPGKEGIDFFESKIRPVLVEHCYKCHSAKSGKAKAGLLLDTRAGMLTGGDTGPTLVAGNPDKSLLIAALRHQSIKMPPKGKLPEPVIADFVRWIKMGAPDPRDGKTSVAKDSTIDIEEGRTFWAFQPLRKATPPKLAADKWSRTPIDAFLLSALRAKGLAPNGQADRRSLIRRLYFDLIGLPPTPQQVQDFLNDKSPDAYEKLVDGLLASEHHGERWARHWLDLARFAESNGYAFDRDRPNAFHYRDFVIKALNSDMPYDQFVRWQIAGDQLAPDDFLALSASGFMVAGPFTTQQTAKERERSRYEQLDDMIQTLGTSMLGLSLGCARCHDHKYDPVAQLDYYRMISCFSEVGFADVDFDKNPEATRKAQEAFDKSHTPFLAARTAYEKEKLPGHLKHWLEKEYSPSPPAPQMEDWHSIGPFADKNFDLAFAHEFGPEKEKSIDLKKTYLKDKLKWTPQPTWKDGAVHNTLTGNNSANYLVRTIVSKSALPVELSLGADDGVVIWLNGEEVSSVKKSAAAADKIKLELMLEPGRNTLLMKVVNAGGTSGFYFKVARVGPPKNVDDIVKLAADKRNARQNAALTAWFTKLDSGWRKLDEAEKQHQRKRPQPNYTKVYASKTRGTTYNFGKDTYAVYLLRRGNVDNKQAPAEPGFLRVLMNAREQEKLWLKPADEKKQPPSRVALAEWLTDTQHGAGHLLARVIVNRLWHHHFGRGIVASPSNFGSRGELPSHPEMLDWLAQKLIDGGWKLRPIHRLMVTSAAYMQNGADNPAARKVDPDNRLVWRHSSRRLEAESIRDALLKVSGTLDSKMYGSGSLDERSTRRSIYLTVKRSALIPFLQLFDAPDAMQGIGDRSTTTVAPQALAMMNSPYARDLARKLARRVRPDNKVNVEQAIDNAYLIALSRPPSADEKTRMESFVARQAAARGGNAAAQELAMIDFCHVLLCSNEFVYVD